MNMGRSISTMRQSTYVHKNHSQKPPCSQKPPSKTTISQMSSKPINTWQKAPKQRKTSKKPKKREKNQKKKGKIFLKKNVAKALMEQRGKPRNESINLVYT